MYNVGLTRKSTIDAMMFPAKNLHLPRDFPATVDSQEGTSNFWCTAGQPLASSASRPTYPVSVNLVALEVVDAVQRITRDGAATLKKHSKRALENMFHAARSEML